MLHRLRAPMVGITVSTTFALFYAGPASADISDDTAKSGELEEIVVTALHETSLLSKTPIAMSAISAEGLRDAGITNPTALGEAVPNLAISRANGGLQITIRGVTSNDNTEKGDPSAAFLLDGVYIARPQAQEVSFFDLERVEVLRGPQGTLYGRNTTAGVINVISARPKEQFESSVEAAYGNYNTMQASAMLNAPLSPKFAVRGAVNLERRDSYITLGSPSPYTLSPYKDNASVRLSGLLEINDDASLLVRGDYSQIKGRITNFVPVTNFFRFNGGVPAAGPSDPNPTFYSNNAATELTSSFAEATQTSRNNKSYGVTGELNWRLGSGEATYIGSYRQFDRNEVQSTQDGGNPATFNGTYRQNSQEVRFAFGKQQPLHGQVGAYYFREQSGIQFFFINPQDFGFAPNIKRFGFPQDPTISESIAGFGQLTYNITDDLHLTGGARYSHDNKSRIGNTVIDDINGARTVLSPNDASRTYAKTTWRMGLDYDLSGIGILYATVSTGYKAGGFNDGCLVGTGPACNRTAAQLYYNPETLTAYEAGFKFKFLDNRLRVNGSAFSYDYRDLQLSVQSRVCGGICQVTQNAAKAAVKGLELESTFVVDARNKFEASLNLLDAHYVNFVPVISPAVVDWSGFRLDRSPRVTAALGYTFTVPFDSGASLAAGVRTIFSSSYVLGDFSTSFDLVPAVYQSPGFHKTETTLTYTSQNVKWFVQGYAKNLENVITQTGLDSADSIVGDPRVYGVRTGIKF